MAWWDAKKHRRLGSSCAPAPSPEPPRPKKRLALGDAFPQLEPEPQRSTNMTADQRRALLSPVFEDHQPALPVAPALTVHVEIQFTDPVIRSRYARSYGTSPDFVPTQRICRGLLRRIERCSQELLTRKDSTALDMFKEGTFERKPLRYEMAFRIATRDGGEWAGRTYRSYQKQPLTVGLTKDIILASHRMVGLFLRRHDEGFQWLDGAVRDTSLEGPQTTSPLHGAPLTLLSVPGSRFIESSQSFELVPGYTIVFSLRNRHPQRSVPVYGRTVRVKSEQTAPLNLFMSEDLLWKGLQAINHDLEQKKREFDAHVAGCFRRECHHSSDDESLSIELRVANNLGPVYRHLCRSVRSNLALFRDVDARDCDEFLRGIEAALGDVRAGVDAKISELDDFEFKIVELRGTGWSASQPATFSLDSSTSYGRRTIQAALDRIQTGIADVLRGHDVAIHISAYKRGHPILDKVIIAHAKRGKPAESFPSPEDARAAFVSRLKTRIQRDIDMVFEDTCSIDDIPDEEILRPLSTATAVEIDISTPETHAGSLGEDQLSCGLPSVPTTSVQGSPKPRVQRVFSLTGRPPRTDTDSIRSAGSMSDLRAESTPTTPVNDSPIPRARRMFSLTGRSSARSPGRSPRTDVDSVRSVASINDLRSDYSTNATSFTSDTISERASVLSDERPPTVVISPVKSSQRRFPLVTKRYSARVSNASTLIEEFPGGLGGNQTADSGHNRKVEEGRDVDRATPNRNEGAENVFNTCSDEALTLVASGEAKSNHVNVGARREPAAGPEISLANGSGSICERQRSIEAISQRKMASPELCEDAAAFAPATGLADIKLETSDPKVGRASPGIEVYCSATPSTPGLSARADSTPRNSFSITPTCLRTQSGAGDPVLKDLEPESERESNAMCVEAEIDVAPDRRAGEPTGQRLGILQLTGTGPAPGIMATSAVFTGGPDGSSDARADSLTAEPSAIEIKPEHEDQGLSGWSQSVELGAERASDMPDSCGMHPADFPTNQVQTSHPGSENILNPERMLDPHGDRVAEPVVNEAFGPAGLWGILAGSDMCVEPEELAVDKSPGLADFSVAPASSVARAVCVEPESELAVDESPAPANVCDTLPSSIVRVEAAYEPAANEALGPVNLRGILAGSDVRVKPETEISLDKALGPADLGGISTGSEAHPAPSVKPAIEILPEQPEACQDGEPQLGDEVDPVAEAPVAGVARDETLSQLVESSGEEDIELPKLPGDSIEVLKSSVETEASSHDAVDKSSTGGVYRDVSEPVGHSEAGDSRAMEERAVVDSDTSVDVATEQAVTLPGPDASPDNISDRCSVMGETEIPAQIEAQKIHDYTFNLGREASPVPAAGPADEVHPSVEDSEATADSGTVVLVAEVPTSGDKTVAETSEAGETAQVEVEKADDVQGGEETNAASNTVKDVSDFIEPESQPAGQSLEDEPLALETRALEVKTDNDSELVKQIQPDLGDLGGHPPGQLNCDAAKSFETDIDNERDASAADLETDTLVPNTSGSGPEIIAVTSELGDGKAAVAPAISVQDFTALAPAANSSVDAPSESRPSEVPDLQFAKLDKPAPAISPPAFNPQYLSPSPLASPRTSTSSFATDCSDYQSLASTRGSVETVRPVEEKSLEPVRPTSRERCQSRPQTAGYLGLGEKRGLDIGLRGALGGSRRRMSLPLQTLLRGQDEPGLDSVDTYITSIETPASSVAGGRVKKYRKRRLGRGKKGKETEDYQAPVIPSVVMLLAGVVAIGKVLKGSSR